MLKTSPATIRFIHDEALRRGNNNCVVRNYCSTSIELDGMYERSKEPTIKLPESIICYGCGKKTSILHWDYVYSCVSCGNLFHKNRYLARPIRGSVAIVTGARTKLGHQICLKLLRAGATVFGTTRFPDKALLLFSRYRDYQNWKERLNMYALDLDVPDMEAEFGRFREFVESKFSKVDILVNCAAQTIRARERMSEDERTETTEHNRYGDSKFVKKGMVNSWNMKLPDLTQKEMEELFRINSIAPVIITKVFLDLLKKSEEPYIINVHAKEGVFNTHKTSKHMHTNMAKSALAMFTRVLIEHGYKSEITGIKFAIHGCDPGWISVDEYEFDSCLWITPPLDEVDGAARILYPLWKMRSSNPKTRRHFEKFIF